MLLHHLANGLHIRSKLSNASQPGRISEPARHSPSQDEFSAVEEDELEHTENGFEPHV